MLVTIYALSKSGHNAIAEWILKSLDPNFDYAVGYYDTLNPANTYYVSKDRLAISKEEFFNHENSILLLEDFDFTQQEIQADCQIIIMRDYPNFWASLHKFIKDNPMHRDMLQIDYGDLWSKYFDEFSGRTKNFKKLISISYNEWFSREDYRGLVFKELGRFGLSTGTLPKGLGVVTREGYGSSFDGFDYKHSPENMKVLERYKSLMKDEDYIKNLKSHEGNVLDSQKFFGIGDPFLKPKDTPLKNFTEEHFQSFFNKEKE